MKRRIFSVLFAIALLLEITNCNLLVSSQQMCADDIKEFDKCYPTLLLVYPGCTDANSTTCGIAVVELAKEICRSKMKEDSCRSHR
ncbi:hypothetical protein EHQ12_13590 [Leptospira gomenensis]|uniref:Uncharacterized protein n=1 Tax=Leptospira gomenensis TaxID=2484974 RepID=A0A5F1YPZ6_9LEPT|nr:hypothetical protein [Leptospira gomenensis]TGK28052.1 hypothetical protein EHQ17_18375 [Leptospira gomenensis]TGK37093.1 hypothetical protein EHQ12_13590 [Leptospira gomenensis]TGK45729.1 hypothetical protein EHQ07_08600 [Leptospira gomenensis]TGK59668.1 hypothetical protein EHQ13_12810 [Leptospira gomenensis]